MSGRNVPWASLRRGLATVVALALLGVVGWLAEHHGTRWYWGASSTATLGEASRQLTAQLDRPIRLTVALPEQHTLRRHVERLADAYRRQHEAFELSFVDPENQSKQARDLGLVRTGQSLIEYGDRAETVGSPTEARLSAALQRMLRRGDRFVAFLTGNGSRDLLGQGNYALGGFGQALERKGFRLQPLDLAATGDVPSNATIVVVAGLKAPLPARQQAALRQYLRGGGGLLWLTEPDSPDPDPVLPATIGDSALTDDASRDRLGVDTNRFIVVEPPFDHPAAGKIESPVVLKGAAGVTAQATDGWQPRPLLPAPERLGGAGGDGLGVTFNHSQWGARAMVVGDVDLLTNTYVGNGSNLRFGVQAMDWLAKADNLIGTYVEPAPDQRLDLSDWRDFGIIGGLLGGIPTLLLIMAGWQWRRLKHG